MLEVKADDLLEKGEIISNLSPFISDTITIYGKELDKSMFIPERPINDPISEDVRLYFDDLNFRWLVNVKERQSRPPDFFSSSIFRYLPTLYIS